MFWKLAIGTFCAAGASIYLQRLLGAPDWGAYLIAGSLGLVIYMTRLWLARRYFDKVVSNDMSKLFVDPDSVAPRYFYWMGATAVCFFLAIPFQLIAWIAR